MYVKFTNGQPDQFPYTVGQLRRDNPNVSFPKKVTLEILASFNVYPVKDEPPAYDPLVERLDRAPIPNGEVVYYKNEEDATDPETGDVNQDQVGEPVYGNWTTVYSVERLPKDQAAENIRAERNRLLAETDWMALSDNTMTQAWADYRQALRDLTAQEGFPYSVEWPTKPE